MATSSPRPAPAGRRPLLSRLATMTAAAGGLATLAVVLRAAAPWEPPEGQWFGVCALLAAVVSPYVGLAWLSHRLPRNPLQGGVALAGVGLTTAFGLSVLLDVLVLNPALLHALAVLAVPPLQWAGCAVTAATVLLVRRFQRPPRLVRLG